jgi:monomeric sarcosine oxidase
VTVALDIIVVGGGVMGCAVAAAAASAGNAVRLLERHRLGNELGSSHGHSRIIRLSYADTSYIALSRNSYALWRELQAEAEQQLLIPTGGIDVARIGTASLERTRGAMVAAGVAFEEWTAADIGRRYPQLRFDDEHVALFQADTALLAANHCIAALARRARRHGAALYEGEAVFAVEADGSGVLVRTSNRSMRADRAIICAGTAMPAFMLGLQLDVPLTVSREQVSYLAVRNEADYLPGRFPICIRHSDAPVLSSILPIFGIPGIKMMIERKRALPQHADGAIDSHNEARVRADAMALIEGVTGEIVRSEACTYTLSSDEDFVIDKHPAHPQIVVCSACSGHGFKFAMAIADILVHLARGGELPDALRMFSIGRPGLAAARKGVAG